MIIGDCMGDYCLRVSVDAEWVISEFGLSVIRGVGG